MLMQSVRSSLGAFRPSIAQAAINWMHHGGRNSRDAEQSADCGGAKAEARLHHEGDDRLEHRNGSTAGNHHQRNDGDRSMRQHAAHRRGGASPLRPRRHNRKDDEVDHRTAATTKMADDVSYFIQPAASAAR